MKYNIAISGTFDVENYGDLMFPVVFQKAMEKRGLKFNLFLFSPSDSAPKALDKSTMVYSFKDFDALHQKYHFDALVVGGGAIIHCHKINVKLPGAKSFIDDYRSLDAWLTPMLFAEKNGIKILFNVPEAPFDFSPSVQNIVRAAFNKAKYLSVRDEYSKQHIEKLYDKQDRPDIRVYPDSVCCIKNYFSEEELTKTRSKLISFDNYAIVHFNHTIPDKAQPGLARAVRRIQQSGMKVVLLPLGYTHGDDVAMVEFNNKYQLDCHTFKQKLNILEMTAVLAGCQLYVGTSFHGAIVTIAYGHKALSYHYLAPLNKNLDMFRMYGVEEYVAKEFKQVNPLLDKILNNKYITNSSEISKLSEKHFDNLYKAIVKRNTTKPSFTIINQMLNLVVDSIKMDSKVEQVIHEKNIVLQEKAALAEQYHQIVNSTSWKITQPLRKLKKH